MDEMLTARATHEARVLRHPYVGTEHLLLAIAELAGDHLTGFGVTAAAAIDRVHEIVGPGQEDVTEAELPFTPRVRRVLRSARLAADADHAADVGTAHLLRALADEPGGVAHQVLTGV